MPLLPRSRPSRESVQEKDHQEIDIIMSYDIHFVDKNGNTVRLWHKHQFQGGTYAVGGTEEASLNITYNYYRFFREFIDGEDGIKSLEGKTAREASQILLRATQAMPVEPPDDDYWKPTVGNARKALLDLMLLSLMVPPESTVHVS